MHRHVFRSSSPTAWCISIGLKGRGHVWACWRRQCDLQCPHAPSARWCARTAFGGTCVSFNPYVCCFYRTYGKCRRAGAGNETGTGTYFLQHPPLIAFKGRGERVVTPAPATGPAPAHIPINPYANQHRPLSGTPALHLLLFVNSICTAQGINTQRCDGAEGNRACTGTYSQPSSTASWCTGTVLFVVHTCISVWYTCIGVEELRASAGARAPVTGYAPAHTPIVIVRWLVHRPSIVRTCVYHLMVHPYSY